MSVERNDVAPDRNILFCPGCDDLLEIAQFEFLGLVEELGKLARYRCKVCQTVFEMLPPSFANYDEHPTPPREETSPM